MGGDENRDERLRRSAELLGVDGLESSADLTVDQANSLIGRLEEVEQKMIGSGQIAGGEQS